MKKILIMAMFMVMGLALATPILAGHHDHYRGHSVRVVRGGYHTACYAPYHRPRHRTSVFFSFGAPFYAPAPVYVYAPPPVLVVPGYYDPLWVPGHYAYRGGARVWIAAYWSR